MVSRKVVTRDEAIESGVNRYFTGEPCSRGHVEDRYVKGGACVKCANAQALGWYYQHKGPRDLKAAADRKLDSPAYPSEAVYGPGAVKEEWEAGKISRKLTPDDIESLKTAGANVRDWKLEKVWSLRDRPGLLPDRVYEMIDNNAHQTERQTHEARTAGKRQETLELCAFVDGLGIKTTASGQLKAVEKLKASLFDRAARLGIFADALEDIDGEDGDG